MQDHVGAAAFSYTLIVARMETSPMKAVRGLRLWLWLVAMCLVAPGCASWYRPPVEKPSSEYTREKIDEERHAKLERDLSLYSD
jgi:hypothetical protein